MTKKSFSHPYCITTNICLIWQLKLEVLNCNETVDVFRYPREGEIDFFFFVCVCVCVCIYNIIIMCIKRFCVFAFGDILIFKVITSIKE